MSNRTQTEFRGRECSVSDPAAQARGSAGKKNRAAAARYHQARRFSACDESGIAGHLPDLAKYAVGRLEQRKIDVRADVEDANFERRVLVGVIQKSGEVIFLARVERARKNPAATGLNLSNQWRELVALSASRENGKTLSREFFCDCAADVVASSDHRRRGISVFQRTTSIASRNGGRPDAPCPPSSLPLRWSLGYDRTPPRR